MTVIHHPAVETTFCSDVEHFTPVHHDAVTHVEVIIDTPATDVTVEDAAAHWQRYSWKGGPIEEGTTPTFPSDNWQANTASDPHGIGHEGAYDMSHGSSGNADWFYLEWVPAVTHDVHTDAITHEQVVVDVEAYDEVLTSSEHECHPVTIPAWDETVADEPVQEPVVNEPMPPCLSEDGSTPGQEFSCIWDAGTSGNGQGCSFVLDEAGGVPHYITSIGEDGTVYTDDTACWTAPVPGETLPETVAQPVTLPVAEVSTATTLTSSEPVALAETGAEPVMGLVLAGAVVVSGVVTLMARRALR